jgi:phosphoglycolate phosphatase
MQKSKYSCVIFDCDGTLIDTLEDIAASMNRSLGIHGFPEVPLEKYKDMVGWGIVRLASLALPQGTEDELVQKVAAEASRFYFENPMVKSRPYPGMVELAAELKARKIKTAVLSNKPDAVLRRVIEGLFSPGLFDAVIGERPGKGRKPDPSLVWELLVELDRSPGSAIFVGDSEIDIETARNSGCYPLGVSWGFRPRSTLETAGAARIIDNPGEIWKILEQR